MLTMPSNPPELELPDFYTLGETRAEVKVHSADEVRNAALSMAEQANYNINIFTQDLDAELYDNPAFEAHVSSLARKHPNTRIRILVQDSGKAAKTGHRLIRLSQFLTSSVIIHKPGRLYQDEKSAFMVVDGLGMIHRVNGDSRHYGASVNFMSPKSARKLNEYFEEAWEHSEPDQQIRRLYM